MGVFDFLNKPKITKHGVTELVGGLITYVINDVGIETLGARSIVLHRDFHISLGVVADMRGGDILAVVFPKELDEFTALSDTDKNMREILMGMNDGGKRMRPLLTESMAMDIDRVSYAVGDEFERQSPEYSRLNPGGFFE